MDSTSTILWALLFGSIGLGFFLYGRKQGKMTPKYCGVALMVYPYFVPDVYWLVGVGMGLVALPYFWRE
ncbi:MAG: hypothetical protein DRR04_12595 [Gammaproteobacteria bacterium]|nr:MAG: hypothetical protein DRR04_12595 [Gammaproteobacteria bacterium]